MLLNLEDIRRRLDVLAAHSEFDLQDLRLRGPGLRSSDFDRIEEVLRCKLPASYREIASAVNFGYFTLGSVQFGSGRYSQADALIAHNSPPLWWGDGERPANFISIGGGDPFVILLRLSNGSILAFDSDLSWKTASVVASDIALFLRGLATAYFLRKEKPASSSAEALNRAVGGESSEFWQIALS